MAETPFQTLWQHSVVGLALVDNEGRFTDANPALCGYLEYTIAELQSRTFQSVTHPDDVAADVHMARSVAEKRAEGYDMVKRYITIGELTKHLRCQHISFVDRLIEPVVTND